MGVKTVKLFQDDETSLHGQPIVDMLKNPINSLKWWFGTGIPLINEC